MLTVFKKIIKKRQVYTCTFVVGMDTVGDTTVTMFYCLTHEWLTNDPKEAHEHMLENIL